jgi:hypothetical protein
MQFEPSEQVPLPFIRLADASEEMIGTGFALAVFTLSIRRSPYRCGAHELNKFVQARPYADPEAAARKIIEIANTIEPVQDGRIHIEKINGAMLYQDKASRNGHRYRHRWAVPTGTGWIAP